jgi:Polyphosphate kinase 2 (PPK2)
MKYWDNYMESYEKVLSMCSTKYAPWYIVPANLKWFRNWVAQIVVKTLGSMKLKYPQPKIDASKFYQIEWYTFIRFERTVLPLEVSMTLLSS